MQPKALQLSSGLSSCVQVTLVIFSPSYPTDRCRSLRSSSCLFVAAAAAAVAAVSPPMYYARYLFLYFCAVELFFKPRQLRNQSLTPPKTINCTRLHSTACQGAWRGRDVSVRASTEVKALCTGTGYVHREAGVASERGTVICFSVRQAAAILYMNHGTPEIRPTVPTQQMPATRTPVVVAGKDVWENSGRCRSRSGSRSRESSC